MVDSHQPPLSLNAVLDGESIKLNIEDLRGRLTVRLALLILSLGQLFILFYESSQSFPLDALFTWAWLTAVGGGALLLVGRRPAWARHLLVWGAGAGLVLLMWFYPTTWLPFLGIVLIFCQAMLVQGSEFVTGFAIVGTAVWLNQQGVRSYPLTGVFVNLLLATLIAWLAIRILYTALDWLWNTHQRAEQLLEANRSQQAELRSVVKSLNVTNEMRLQAERDLLVAHKQAREAQRLKEQFAANISHELRTPLSIILGFSEIMYLSPEVYGEMMWPPKLYRDVSQIYRNSRHLMSMIDDILDLSHFEMSGFTLHKEPTPLAELLQETVALVDDLFQRDGVALIADMEPNLPALEIDRTRIRQVLLNLLNNARHFTEKGSVRIIARQEEDAVRISVQDTGPGIPQEQISRIFTEFYQVDYSMSRKHGGAGLGLAICQRFVNAHDGRIWVESELGQGATFHFTLPIDRASSWSGRPYQNRYVDPRPEEERPRLLVVDGDKSVASLIQRHVEAYEVVSLSDSQALDAAIARHHPAGVLWNLAPGGQLPCADLTEVPAPVIACSIPSQAWRAQALGAAACLTKPLDFAQLHQELDRLPDAQDVLVIDDNAGMCQLIERALSAAERPYSVRVAYDGATGLEMIQRQPPDVLLLDLIMPGLDGFELFERLQQDPALQQIPVILLTATSYPEENLGQQGHQLTIYRADQLRPVEVLRCIQPILQILPARYGEYVAAQKEIA